MLLIEALIKFSSVGVLLVLLLLSLRDGRNVPALRFAPFLLISMICLFLSTGAPELSVKGPLFVTLRLIDMLSFIFAWWFGLALFDDEFKLGWLEWSGAVLYVIAHMPGRLHYIGLNNWWSPNLEIVVSGIVLLMMAHLSFVTIAGHQEDLVEGRRRFRKWFATALVTLIVVSILLERLAGQLGIPQVLSMYTIYLFTLPLAMWAVLWLAKIEPDRLSHGLKSDGKQHYSMDAIDPKDLPAHQRLVSIMQDQRGFAEHGLTIGKLAERVGIPSHQLRSLINKSMGYRNYTAFLNHYRINAIKDDLANPEKSRIPVLSLALDAGFSSLAPFNRAFKSSEGVTPSDYRNQMLNRLSS